jgi:hypothetical protein
MKPRRAASQCRAKSLLGSVVATVTRAFLDKKLMRSQQLR